MRLLLRRQRVQAPPIDLGVLLTPDLHQRRPVLERRIERIAVQQERPHGLAEALLEPAEEDALPQQQVVFDLALLVEQRAVEKVGRDPALVSLVRMQFALLHLRPAHHELSVRKVLLVVAWRGGGGDERLRTALAGGAAGSYLGPV